MDWHAILETTFLVMFWVGLALTVLMGVMSGAFHSEIGAGSSFAGGVAHDLGGPHIESGMPHAGHAEVGWSHGELPGFSPWSPTVICAALTGAGGVGWLALTSWSLSPGWSVLAGVLGGVVLGGVTFATLAFVFKKVQATSHVAAVDMIGREAFVSTAIQTDSAGAISFEAGGGRMVVPARSTDAAPIPVGARVEIVRIEGAVYHVKETRDSWLARSKGTAAR
jgi:hypothetical protein